MVTSKTVYSAIYDGAYRDFATEAEAVACEAAEERRLIMLTALQGAGGSFDLTLPPTRIAATLGVMPIEQYRLLAELLTSPLLLPSVEPEEP